ncbi:hypothetical protein CYMTET_19898 [Cymbomonas tetramitiformis]|uniref:TauD/TfdA-like domain-containing protein n=1 Tax=Cymbomonas tetramitiformis TaxID=36881 RepID=A0AAE0G6F1_9CHLO|nr:hypothetical protein CYMTET_19898 [Cymbomonas tetramitiformis]
MAMRLTALMPHFGVRCDGVSLAGLANRQLPPLVASALKTALYSYGLLYFPATSDMTPADEVAFAKMFSHDPAEDMRASSSTGGASHQAKLPHFPEIALVGSFNLRDYFGYTGKSPGVYQGWAPDQRAWHCDGLADTYPPPDLTTMRAIQIPPSGGDTLFACSVMAAKLLPENLQPHPEHVQVSYRLFNEYEIKPMGMGLDLASGRKVKDVNELNDMKQPLVIREPHSGKRSLVGTYHVSRIEAHGSKALTFEESNNYIAQAWAPGLQDDLLYRHKWQAGDMVAWSNRLVIHTATSAAAYEGETRLHHRIRLRSDPNHAPVPWEMIRPDCA